MQIFERFRNNLTFYFINFRKKKDRADVWQTLKDCLDNDPNATKIAPFSRFDTVELECSRNNRLSKLMTEHLDSTCHFDHREVEPTWRLALPDAWQEFKVTQIDGDDKHRIGLAAVVAEIDRSADRDFPEPGG